eukprot:1177496-Prorocentrum_minimum.AAC.1
MSTTLLVLGGEELVVPRAELLECYDRVGRRATHPQQLVVGGEELVVLRAELLEVLRVERALQLGEPHRDHRLVLRGELPAQHRHALALHEPGEGGVQHVRAVLHHVHVRRVGVHVLPVLDRRVEAVAEVRRGPQEALKARPRRLLHEVVLQRRAGEGDAPPGAGALQRGGDGALHVAQSVALVAHQHIRPGVLQALLERAQLPPRKARVVRTTDDNERRRTPTGSGGDVMVKCSEPREPRNRDGKVSNTRGIFKVCCTSDDQRRRLRAPTLNY